MPNKYKNKVEYFGETLIDISDTTAEAEDVVEGKKFYDRSGAPQTGSASIPSKTSDLINDSGFITIEDIPVSQEIDPTVPAWAKKATKPSYTAQEVGALPDDTYIPEKTSDLTNDSGFVTSENIPTKTSELTNDSGFVTEDRVPIATSDLINDSGFVDDPNYIHTDNNYTTEDKEKLAGVESYVDSVVPKRTSDLTNDSDFVSDANYVHTDSNFTAEEKTKLAGIAAGATVDDHKWGSVQLGGNNVTVQDMFVPYIPTSGNQNIAYRTLASFSPTANYIAKFDANRYLNSKTPAAGDNSTKVATTAYVDNAVPTKTSDLTNDSGFITREDLPSDTGVVSVNGKDGIVVLDADDVGALPDTTVIPTKTSDLTNDSGFITGYTETDPTVPNWAKQPNKPSYTAAEVGALPDNTYIPNKTSDLTNDSGFITTGDIPAETDPTVPAWAKKPTKPSYTATEVGALPDNTYIPNKTSDLMNDSGFITGYTETDPTVPSWAKAASKPTYTAAEVGALPDDTAIPTKTSDLTNDSGFITAAQAPPEIFWITVTQSDSTYTSDKTFTEIKAAHDDGKLCLMIDPSGGVDRIFRLHYVSSSELSFTRSGKTANGPFIQDMTMGTDNSWTLVTQYAQNRITASGLLKGDGSGGVTGIATGSSTTTYLRNDGEWGTPPNNTYNFAGTTFNSGKSDTAEHNANNILKNGHYYYTSNGPAKTLGASTDDGALYAQSYSDSWVAQIAQDYRNGALFVRGKNNGTWANWQKVYDSAHKPTAADVGAAASSHNHNIQDLTNFSSRVYDATISRTKNTVLAAPNGSNGAASFRALVAADIPTLTKSKISDFPTSMTPTAHNHAAGDINSGTLGVARGGTGAASFTANCAIISGSSTTAALTTRAIRNNTATSGAVTADTALITSNTLRYAINRTTSVAAADTGYTTLMARGIGLRNADTNPGVNGAINFTYE